jgi:hypothetical protein
MFSSANKQKIASVGMLDEQAGFFKKFLKDYANKLESKWVYVGNYDATETIDNMGSNIDAEFLIIDIDDEVGRRVWYFLSALRDENKTIAFTREAWNTDAKWVIKKPLFDYSVKKSLFDFSKDEKSIEPDAIVELVNKIDSLSSGNMKF